MAGFPGVPKAITWLTIAVELTGPLVLIMVSHWRARLFLIATFILFHIAISQFLTVGLFGPIGIVAWLPILPAICWDQLGFVRTANQLKSFSSTTLALVSNTGADIRHRCRDSSGAPSHRHEDAVAETAVVYSQSHMPLSKLENVCGRSAAASVGVRSRRTFRRPSHRSAAKWKIPGNDPAARGIHVTATSSVAQNILGIAPQTDACVYAEHCLSTGT